MLTASPLMGQKLPAGPQVLTFYSDVDDTEQPYGLYLPPDFDEDRAYPLVISLHGAGSNHRLNLKRVFGKSNIGDETDVEASRYFQPWEDVSYIVASPLARGTMGYEGIAEKDVLDVLDDVRSRFRVDENRIYLTGLSMGGGGTLHLGLTRPDLWAAIAPVCPAPPSGTDALAGNALNLPIYIHQGGDDPVVPAAGVRAWVQRFESLGTDVRYTEYPGVGHNSWENAYAEGQIFDWFDQHVRNPFPDRVRFVSDRYKYRSAYWVAFDRLTPGVMARIDARFIATNRLTIESDKLDAFTLALEGHPKYEPGSPVHITIDGVEVRSALPMISLHRVGEAWQLGRSEPDAAHKRPGLEGPVSEVVAARHVYVFGTEGEPSDTELAARRMQAEHAANWSVYRGPFLGRIAVFPRVIADRDLRPSDLQSANLVLFGTKETNSAISRIADDLPFHLSDTTGTYGLVYVVPSDDRHILISSGMPWWQARGGSGNFFATQVAALTLPNDVDYFLFRHEPFEVIARGRFADDWSLPADALDWSTGVVARH